MFALCTLSNYHERVLIRIMYFRFRQDGIRKAQIVKSAKVIPYGPSGHEFDKFRIILHKLVPGTQQLFPNDTLTPLQRVRRCL